MGLAERWQDMGVGLHERWQDMGVGLNEMLVLVML